MCLEEPAAGRKALKESLHEESNQPEDKARSGEANSGCHWEVPKETIIALHNPRGSEEVMGWDRRRAGGWLRVHSLVGFHLNTFLRK